MKISDLRNLMQNVPLPVSAADQIQQQALLKEIGIDLGQFYQELEMESRFVDTHQDLSFSNANVQLHSHSFYEILYCCNTCGAEYLVGTERYRLQKGDIILVAPGISHRPMLPEHMTEPYKRYVLWISSEFMEALIQSFPFIWKEHAKYSALLRTGGTGWESLGPLFYSGVWESETRGPGWEAAVIGNTVHLIALLYRAFVDHSTAPMKAEKPELMDQVLAYVEDHLSEKITLSEVAHHFFVSESTISQTFRKRLGVSFYRCVTQRRLIAAKALIEKGTALETVAHQVGFADYSSFYRAFKQEYGISPRQYRKLQETPDPIL